MYREKQPRRRQGSNRLPTRPPVLRRRVRSGLPRRRDRGDAVDGEGHALALQGDEFERTGDDGQDSIVESGLLRRGGGRGCIETVVEVL
jgi:hypothetical protein